MKEDWVDIEIGEVANLYQPKTISSKMLVADGKYQVYGANGIIGNYNKYNHEERELLITCRGATCGNVHITKPYSWINGNAMVVKPFDKELLNLMYIKLFFSIKGRTQKAITGSAQPQITRTTLFPIEIPLAPLPVQRAIVTKIENLFTSLDKGIADLKKAQEQLKVYRQAVLKKAFDKGNQSYKIEEICHEIFAGGDKPKKYFSKVKTDECNVPIFANAIPNNGLYGYTKVARVTEKAITIAARGSGTGHVELREKPFLPIVRLITVIPNIEVVNIYYLMYFLKNMNIQRSGSAIPQLTIPMVKEYNIFLPSLQEQIQIVREIESRLSVCDKIEQSISETLEKSEALRQSILKKTFEGKLLSETEITKCKQEADYEPANVLLERIKKEKHGK